MFLEFRDIAGKLVQLPIAEDSEPVTIGRNPGSTIYSKESTVSRNHGRIGFDGKDFYIKDLGSSNGTYINGERTRRGVVGEGDTVRCGEVLEIVLRPGAPDQAKSSPRTGEQRRRKQQPTVMGRAPSGEDIAREQARAAARGRDRHRHRGGRGRARCRRRGRARGGRRALVVLAAPVPPAALVLQGGPEHLRGVVPA